MFVADDDHNRLKAIDAKLYSPLATTLPDGTTVPIRETYEQVMPMQRNLILIVTGVM